MRALASLRSCFAPRRESYLVLVLDRGLRASARVATLVLTASYSPELRLLARALASPRLVLGTSA